MRTYTKIHGLMILATLSALPACAARYHTIHKAQGGSEKDPQEPVKSEDAVPKAPQAPSAVVEVIAGGQSVTKVASGDDFTIRPTADSRDPDNGTPANCPNPGLMKAVYKISDGAEKIAQRSTSAPCTALDVPHQIVVPGSYTVTLTVTSDENETATSSMTLIVTAVTEPTNPGGFVVTAVPSVAYPGDPITFKGDCKNYKTISWDYADAAKGKGEKTTHAYKTPGQYVVKANCERPDGSKLDSSVSVAIIPKPNTPPSPTDGTGDGSGTGNDGNGNDGNGTGNDGNGNDASSTDGPGGNGNDASSTDGPGGDGNSNDGQGGDGHSTDGNGGDGNSTDGNGGDGSHDGDDDLPPVTPNTPGQNPHQSPYQGPGQTPKTK